MKLHISNKNESKNILNTQPDLIYNNNNKIFIIRRYNNNYNNFLYYMFNKKVKQGKRVGYDKLYITFAFIIHDQFGSPFFLS